jgi:hypothetical protein
LLLYGLNVAKSFAKVIEDAPTAAPYCNQIPEVVHHLPLEILYLSKSSMYDNQTPLMIAFNMSFSLSTSLSFPSKQSQ